MPCRRPACRGRLPWLAAGALILLHAAPAAGGVAAAEWTAEAFLGGACNFRTTLRIEQGNHPATRWDASYRTRAFEPPLYYALRIARWTGDSAWGLELVHHKLYLEDRPPEVQDFAISHGYNLLAIGRARRWLGMILWAHAGAVIAHPENTVRGLRLSESRGALGTGYYLAGATVGASVAKRVALGERWFAAFEAGLAGCSARVPVEGGHADVPNAALHLWAGISHRWQQRSVAAGHARAAGYIHPRGPPSHADARRAPIRYREELP